MIKALIIDDEEDGRETLRICLEKYFPEIKLIAICGSADEGLCAIKDTSPHLVFLDIQMPQMSGFDLLNQVSPVNFQVIFVTAHDQYAIKAIRFSALDYLLKPVDIDDLREAIEKVKRKLSLPILLNSNPLHKTSNAKMGSWRNWLSPPLMD